VNPLSEVSHWRQQRFFRALERFELAEDMPCDAFGGCDRERTRVRLCDKRRWHLDSHAYEWQDIDPQAPRGGAA
jgi:hypothetical protein